MSLVHRRGPTAPDMNITPLIDVVFLLIIFFMLVSRIVADENVPMVVPALDDPKTYEPGQIEKIVVNVVPAAGDRRGRNPGSGRLRIRYTPALSLHPKDRGFGHDQSAFQSRDP